MCSSNTSNKSPAMCTHKTRHEHTAIENTHKPCVQTKHDNIKAHSQCKTQAACCTRQDMKVHETRHRQDKTKQECQGSVTKPRNRLDRSDRTLTPTGLRSIHFKRNTKPVPIDRQQVNKILNPIFGDNIA